jgi:hypothetical protein
MHLLLLLPEILREKTKMNENESGNRQGKRYRIPPQLILELFKSI